MEKECGLKVIEAQFKWDGKKGSEIEKRWPKVKDIGDDGAFGSSGL